MDIRIDDIPYDLHAMVDIIGVDKFLEVCKLYGGIAVYLPIHSRVTIGSRNRQMVKEYNGKNLDFLRVKYGISNQQVKKILRDNGVGV